MTFKPRPDREEGLSYLKSGEVSSRKNSVGKGSVMEKLGLWEESVGLEGREPLGGGKSEPGEESGD